MARVLVIDDEETIRIVIRRLLEPYGHDVILGEDGLRGFGMAQHQRPDVIVLDLMMPLVDGFETLGFLREDPRTADRPVIVLSAMTGEQVRQRCLDAGAVEVLAKPFEPEVLQAAIVRALDR
ncbi:MAG TPA: response regulator [Actinomycetota bacterium]